MGDFFARMRILGELLQFLWMRQHYWLLPMIVMLIIIAAVFVFTAATGGAGSLMYTLW